MSTQYPIEKHEKATRGDALVLRRGRSLKQLWLHCTMKTSSNDRTHYQTDEVEKIQQACEMLFPSPNLQYIFLLGFPVPTMAVFTAGP
jgi:hypothetical protein